MLSTTPLQLCCPSCAGPIALIGGAGPVQTQGEILKGELACKSCESTYPILAGVAILVPDVESYIGAHIKGISRAVPESEMSKKYRGIYREALAELREMGVEHIEEDLESARINSLYLMNHYLRVGATPPDQEWWMPSSPLFADLIRKHWDHGPFEIIREKCPAQVGNVVELGCGAGGLARELAPRYQTYLGVDGSFAAILLARKLNLGVGAAPGSSGAHIEHLPGDLWNGPLARAQSFEARVLKGVDFVVGDIHAAPIQEAYWDQAIALNALDMLEDPESLPQAQKRALKPGGVAIQSCPYIWHEGVIESLRQAAPKEIKDSARAGEWMYERLGLKTEWREDQVPWLFFKHLRQLEIYSVHIWSARC